jgi:hypothetical protein
LVNTLLLPGRGAGHQPPVKPGGIWHTFCLAPKLWPVRHGRTCQQLRCRRHSSQLQTGHAIPPPRKDKCLREELFSFRQLITWEPRQLRVYRKSKWTHFTFWIADGRPGAQEIVLVITSYEPHLIVAELFLTSSPNLWNDSWQWKQEGLRNSYTV